MYHYFNLSLPEYIESEERFVHPEHPYLSADCNGIFYFDQEAHPEYKVSYNFARKNLSEKIQVQKKDGKIYRHHWSTFRIKFLVECYTGQTIWSSRQYDFLDFNPYNFHPDNIIKVEDMSKEWKAARKEFDARSAREAYKRIIKIYPHLRNTTDMEEAKRCVDFYLDVMLIPKVIGIRLMKIFKTNCP